MGEKDLFDPRGEPDGDGEVEAEHGPLAERLSKLRWPAPEPDLAQRSWKRFQRRLAEKQERSGGDPDDPA